VTALLFSAKKNPGQKRVVPRPTFCNLSNC